MILIKGGKMSGQLDKRRSGANKRRIESQHSTLLLETLSRKITSILPPGNFLRATRCRRGVFFTRPPLLASLSCIIFS